MKTRIAIILVSFGVLVIPRVTYGSTLTFEDLSPGTSYVPVPFGYSGLIWDQFLVIDGLQPQNYGFSNGVISAPNVVFNAAGNAASISGVEPFDFNSAYLTSKDVTGFQVRVQGLVRGNVVYDNSYTLSTNAPTFINFGYTQIDRVNFTSIPGRIFILDNLDISNMVDVTPQCSSLASPPLKPGMVQGWGCFNNYGLINTGCFSNIVAIAAGVSHSLLLKNDGKVLAFGDAILTLVPSRASNVIAVSCGKFHSLALRSNGTVVAWGYNAGDAINVPKDLTNVVAISAGYSHSVVLKSGGTVVAFGSAVPSGLSNIVAVSAGNDFTLALKADGTVTGWKRDLTSLYADFSSLSNIVAISGGPGFYGENLGEVLRDDGVVLAGKAFTNSWTPVLSNIVAISATRGSDGWISWALRSDGKVAATSSDFHFCGEPLVPNGLSNVVSVSSGDSHQLALIGNGPPVLSTRLLNPEWGTEGFQVSVQTQYGRVYRLEYNNALDESDWVGLPLVAGNGGLQTLTDSTASQSQKFYRVRRW